MALEVFASPIFLSVLNGSINPEAMMIIPELNASILTCSREKSVKSFIGKLNSVLPARGTPELKQTFSD
jgi:hypothetical protein